MAPRISFNRFDLSESLSTHQVTKTAAANAAKITSTAAQPDTARPVPAIAVAAAPSAVDITTTTAVPS